MLTLARTVNPFVYPGYRLPGFDPTHPASTNVRMSATAATGTNNFISSLNGSRGTLSGSGSALINGSIGPAVQSVTTSGVSFAGPAVSDPVITFGLIYVPNNQAGFNPLLLTGTSGGYYYLAQNGTSNFIIGVAGANNHSFLTPFTVSVGTPYFLAASVVFGSSPLINSALTNLSTGQSGALFDGSSIALTTTTSNGFYNIQNSAAFGQASGSTIAAAMVSGVYLTLTQLRAWAADPWSFWYPPAVEELIFNSMGGLVIPPVIIPNPYTLMPQIVT